MLNFLKTVFSLIALFLILAEPSRSNSTFRVILPTDDPGMVSGAQPMERNLTSLDSQATKSTILALKPWANGYWAMELGLTGNRYRDPGFAAKGSWPSRFEYIKKNSLQNVLLQTDSKKRARLIDQLSPAEKYDLLVGDAEATLTSAQWAEGQRYYQDGTLANWMGICEGTAAASVMFPEPKRSLELFSPQGDKIQFQETDIKGLAALLWSSYNLTVPVTGTRCSSRNPERRNGVVIDESCFNTNPGAFHIALLNLLGKRKQVLFMNRVSNQEVWNVPIIAYKTQYHSPNKNHGNKDLQQAVLPIAQVDQDEFTSLRSAQTAFVVGVQTTVKFGTGVITQATYDYDLEMDINGIIIGGEWHSSSHPDFLWTVENGFRPVTIGDNQLGNQVWNDTKIPAEWLRAARLSSQNNQPLELIVSELVRRSSK